MRVYLAYRNLAEATPPLNSIVGGEVSSKRTLVTGSNGSTPAIQPIPFVAINTSALIAFDQNCDYVRPVRAGNAG